MTVKELIERLERYPSGTVVYIPDKYHKGWFTKQIDFDYSNEEMMAGGGDLYLK